MKQRCSYLLLFLYAPLLLLPLLAAGVRTEALVGRWKPIGDLNDPHMKEIGEFAVTEYNKQSTAELKFQRVVKGETQVVFGTNYRLVAVAKDGMAAKKYEAACGRSRGGTSGTSPRLNL